jgi:hypothetical protein
MDQLCKGDRVATTAYFGSRYRMMFGVGAKIRATFPLSTKRDINSHPDTAIWNDANSTNYTLGVNRPTPKVRREPALWRAKTPFVTPLHTTRYSDKAAGLLRFSRPKPRAENISARVYWSGRWDSNPRPQPWQGCALPLSYARIRSAERVLSTGERRASKTDSWPMQALAPRKPPAPCMALLPGGNFHGLCRAETPISLSHAYSKTGPDHGHADRPARRWRCRQFHY